MTQLSVSPAPFNYRKPRPLEYADLDEGEEVTHNDGCDCRTCRAWAAQEARVRALIAERDQLSRRLIVERHPRWGWHFRLWLSNNFHAGYSEAFGWHVKAGRFVRARSY